MKKRVKKEKLPIFTTKIVNMELELSSHVDKKYIKMIEDNYHGPLNRITIFENIYDERGFLHSFRFFNADGDWQELCVDEVEGPYIFLMNFKRYTEPNSVSIIKELARE